MVINAIGPGGLRRYVAAAMALPFALASTVSAWASDAELQDALRRARCGSPTIKQLSQLGSVTVYEANCFRSSHRVITVTCTVRTCTVHEPEVNLSRHSWGSRTGEYSSKHRCCAAANLHEPDLAGGADMSA